MHQQVERDYKHMIIVWYSTSWPDTPDLSSEGTAELHVAVLCGNLYTVAHKLRSRDQIDGRRSDDNL